MQPSDTVIYHGRPARVIEIVDAPTPGGGTVRAVLIERPRAGRKWVMFAEVDPDAVPQTRQATEEPFGHFGPDPPR